MTTTTVYNLNVLGSQYVGNNLTILNSTTIKRNLTALRNMTVVRNATIRGNLYVRNVVRARSKGFVIPHPSEDKKEQGLLLQHGCIEGPENGVYYRGEGTLVNGETIIELPDYFEDLVHIENRSVQLTPKVNNREEASRMGNLFATQVVDGKFSVFCNSTDSTDSTDNVCDICFWWEVKGDRKDIPKLVVETPETVETPIETAEIIETVETVDN